MAHLVIARRLGSGRTVLAVVAASCLASFAVHRGHAGYDLEYALIWGERLADGHAPQFTGQYAPTPHPLANGVAALLAPFGRSAAADMFLVLVAMSLGVVAVATWSIGRSMLGRWVGVLAAVVVVSRPVLVGSTLRGSIDIPALALTLSALALMMRPQPRWLTALVLLAFAGLLRPEVWLLSLGLAGWRWIDSGRSRRIALTSAALALAAPVTWGLTDLVLTSDPAFSLTGTRALAEELARPRSAGLAPLLAPSLMSTVTGLPVLLGGALGLAVYAGRQPRYFLVVIGAFGLSLLAFLIIGVADLPLLARYMFPPAVLLTILGCGTALRAAPMGCSARDTLVTIVAVAALLLAIPWTIKDLERTVVDSDSRRTVQRDLRELVARPSFARAMRECPPLSVSSYRMVPVVAYGAGLTPTRIATDSAQGLLLLPRSGRAASSLTSASDPAPPLLRPPPGYRLDPRIQSRDWAVALSCASNRSRARPSPN